MDAVYWFAVGAATGITFTAIELRHRWVRDRTRLTNALNVERNYMKADRAFHQTYLAKLQRELDQAHTDLHAIKRDRLETWKGNQDARR